MRNIWRLVQLKKKNKLLKINQNPLDTLLNKDLKLWKRIRQILVKWKNSSSTNYLVIMIKLSKQSNTRTKKSNCRNKNRLNNKKTQKKIKNQKEIKKMKNKSKRIKAKQNRNPIRSQQINPNKRNKRHHLNRNDNITEIIKFVFVIKIRQIY